MKFRILLADGANMDQYTAMLDERYGPEEDRAALLDERRFVYWSQAYEFIACEGGGVHIAWLDFLFGKNQFDPEYTMRTGKAAGGCNAEGLLLLLLLRTKRPGAWPFYLYSDHRDSTPLQSYDAEILYRYLQQSERSGVVEFSTGNDPAADLKKRLPSLFRAARGAVVTEKHAHARKLSEPDQGTEEAVLDIISGEDPLAYFQEEVRKAIVKVSAKRPERIEIWKEIYQQLEGAFRYGDWTCRTFFPLEFLRLERIAAALRPSDDPGPHGDHLQRGLEEMCSDWRPIAGLFNRECLGRAGAYSPHPEKGRRDLARRRWIRPAFHLSASSEGGQWTSLADRYDDPEAHYEFQPCDWVNIWHPAIGLPKILEVQCEVPRALRERASDESPRRRAQATEGDGSRRYSADVIEDEGGRPHGAKLTRDGVLRRYTIRDCLYRLYCGRRVEAAPVIEMPDWCGSPPEDEYSVPEDLWQRRFLTNLAEWRQLLLERPDALDTVRVPDTAAVWWQTTKRSSLFAESAAHWDGWDAGTRPPLRIALDWLPGPVENWKADPGTVDHKIRLFYADNGPGVDLRAMQQRLADGDGGFCQFVLPRARVWASEIRMYWKRRDRAQVWSALLSGASIDPQPASPMQPELDRIWRHFTAESGTCFEFVIAYPRFERLS